MSRSVETKRIVALLGLAIATLLVLSALGYQTPAEFGALSGGLLRQDKEAKMAQNELARSP